jgi:hypothetical protein
MTLQEHEVHPKGLPNRSGKLGVMASLKKKTVSMPRETKAELKYVSDGLTREWAVPFDFLGPEDLLVVRSDGVNAALKIDYSIEGTRELCGGYTNGGVLVWLTGQPPPSGITFSISRHLSAKQRDLSCKQWSSVATSTTKTSPVQLRRRTLIVSSNRPITSKRLALVQKNETRRHSANASEFEAQSAPLFVRGLKFWSKQNTYFMTLR